MPKLAKINPGVTTKNADSDSDGSSSDENEISEESTEILVKNNILAYQQLWNRFNKKKSIYTIGFEYYKWKNFIIFTVPLLCLQILNAILPSILPSSEEQTLKIIITIISSVSAAIIALQSKLRWPETSEKFNGIASAYGLLVSDSYFQLNESKIKHKMEIDRGKKVDVESNNKDLLFFLEKCQKLEKHVLAKAPLVPNWIKRKVEEKLLPANGSHGAQTSANATGKSVTSAASAHLHSFVNSSINPISDALGEQQPNQIASLYETPNQAYTQLWKRFSRKKSLYYLSSERFHKFDLFIFVIPLLIFQICNAVLPTALKNEPETARIVTTILAAISAAFIAAQGKLRFGEIAEQYANVAMTYNNLVADAYFMMTQSDTVEKSKLNKNKNGKHGKCYRKGFRDLIYFLKETQKMEKNSKTGCPVVPLSIQKKIKNSESNKANIDLNKLKAKERKDDLERQRHVTDELKVFEREASMVSIMSCSSEGDPDARALGGDLVQAAPVHPSREVIL